jgi:DNA (cytosine-5)-methyltransferase 1
MQHGLSDSVGYEYSVGSLFSGIGGFDLGLEQAGWQVAWQVENDPFCQKILKKHWKDVPRRDDIRTFEPACFPWVRMIAAGFPCQDFSYAGKRRGLAGAQSGLFSEVVRIVGIIKPEWLILENVPGLLTSKGGEDFAEVLSALEQLGFGVAWGVLDARWFGIPQARRRLFVVGRAGRYCPPQVLAPPPDRGIPAEPGKGAEPAARTLTRMYRMCVADRLSVGFVPAGTFIRACPHPHRVREVDGLSRRLDPARIGALGNAVCVPIAKMLGENIKRIMEEDDGDRYQERRIQGGDQSQHPHAV